MSSSRSAAKRLIKELDTWRSESTDEKGIERLGPINESDLLTWEAVINGRGVGGGYDGMFPPPFLSTFKAPSLTFTLSLYIYRRSLAPHNRHPTNIPTRTTHNPLPHAHRPSQHPPRHGRDLPRLAQGRVDARVQYLRDGTGDSRRPASVSRGGFAAECGRGGIIAGRGRGRGEEVG